MDLLFALIGLLVVVGDVLCADKTATAGGTTIKVLGQSGKIKMYNASETESEAIMITMDAISEKTADGDSITGQSRHSFNNFAQLDFAFSDLVNDTYMDTGLDVVYFNFMANMTVDAVDATLTTYIYLFKETGNITADGENVTVNEGDMKFNVEIKNWPFCGQGAITCKKGNADVAGAFLDFEIKITGTKEPNATTGDVGGAKVITPKEVLYDNTTTKDMPTGYPNTSISGRDTSYTFRFEPFDTSVLYDPIVSRTSDNNDDNGGSAEVAATASGVTAKLKGASGKIEIMFQDSEVVVELDNLKEMKADGTAVTDQGHSFNTFAGKAFTLIPVEDAQYGGINAKRIRASTTLSNSAMVKLDLYVMQDAGNVTNGDETIMIKPGNVKFNIEISDWIFCDNGCTSKYLDIQVVMKGKKSKPVKKQSANNTGEMYDLGGSSVVLSRKIHVDNGSTPVTMETGYPMLETKGSKELFSFRFPKFTTKVVYDPVIAYDKNESSGSTKVKATLSMAMGVMILAMLRRLL